MSRWVDAHDAVRQAVDDCRPLGEIEAGLLNGLPEDEAAALWLYAWSYGQVRQRGARPAAEAARIPRQGQQISTSRGR